VTARGQRKILKSGSGKKLFTVLYHSNNKVLSSFNHDKSIEVLACPEIHSDEESGVDESGTRINKKRMCSGRDEFPIIQVIIDELNRNTR
jgi:hypothetical protein